MRKCIWSRKRKCGPPITPPGDIRSSDESKYMLAGYAYPALKHWIRQGCLGLATAASMASENIIIAFFYVLLLYIAERFTGRVAYSVGWINWIFSTRGAIFMMDLSINTTLVETKTTVWIFVERLMVLRTLETTYKNGKAAYWID